MMKTKFLKQSLLTGVLSIITYFPIAEAETSTPVVIIKQREEPAPDSSNIGFSLEPYTGLGVGSRTLVARQTAGPPSDQGETSYTQGQPVLGLGLRTPVHFLEDRFFVGPDFFYAYSGYGKDGKIHFFSGEPHPATVLVNAGKLSSHLFRLGAIAGVRLSDTGFRVWAGYHFLEELDVQSKDNSALFNYKLNGASWKLGGSLAFSSLWRFNIEYTSAWYSSYSGEKNGQKVAKIGIPTGSDGLRSFDTGSIFLSVSGLFQLL